MKLLTPPRVTALLWLGAVGVLVWLTLAPTSLLTWSDPVDSVERLSPERACALAHLAVPGSRGGDCSGFTSDTLAAHLVINGQTICFLKAARWFVIDEGFDIPCPLSPPMEPVRIIDFDDEQRAERRLTESARASRMAAVLGSFPEKLHALVTRRRSQPWPSTCPPLRSGKVEALDANLAAADGAKWHFLTGETIEAVLLPGSQSDLRFDALERLRRMPTLLLIDASVKRLPESGMPGLLEATATLIDWRGGEVLCERPFTVAQTDLAEVDHGTLSSSLPPLEVRMTDFKERVATALTDVTRELSDGGLVLEPTW